MPLLQVHCSRPTCDVMHAARSLTNWLLSVVSGEHPPAYTGLSRLYGESIFSNDFHASSGRYGLRLGNNTRTILVGNGFSLVAKGCLCMCVRVRVVVCSHCTKPGYRVQSCSARMKLMRNLFSLHTSTLCLTCTGRTHTAIVPSSFNSWGAKMALAFNSATVN